MTATRKKEFAKRLHKTPYPKEIRLGMIVTRAIHVDHTTELHNINNRTEPESCLFSILFRLLNVQYDWLDSSPEMWHTFEPCEQPTILFPL